MLKVLHLITNHAIIYKSPGKEVTMNRKRPALDVVHKALGVILRVLVIVSVLAELIC